MILLNSVGTALTRKLITHPINKDGTIDKNEGTAAHVYDLDNEWYCSLSVGVKQHPISLIKTKAS